MAAGVAVGPCDGVLLSVTGDRERTAEEITAAVSTVADARGTVTPEAGTAGVVPVHTSTWPASSRATRLQESSRRKSSTSASSRP